MDIFRVRLNNVDHYQSSPTDLDPPLFGAHGSTQRTAAPQLPVIRVFGATETGQKVCAHIHGALPYLYIEYRGSLEKDLLYAYIQQLRASIDHALAVSYRRNVYDGKATYAAHITLVKGIPFFGYHVGYRFFLKIYMLNPMHMTRFADLLHQGAIMAQVFQPFESHLQYLLQWMCDFNLYGCAYIDCKAVSFRGPVPSFEEVGDSNHKWHDRSVGSEQILDPVRFPRQSHCAIEVDIKVQDILNRDEIAVRDLHADFLERTIAASPDAKLVRSLAGLWRDETRRRKLRMGLTDPSSSPFPPEVLITMSAGPRSVDKGGWIHEEEFRKLVDEIVAQERPEEDDAKSTFENFVHTSPLEAGVPTVLESVTHLFPANLYAYAASFGDDLSETFTSVDKQTILVDETSISQVDGIDFPYDFEGDGNRDDVVKTDEDILGMGKEQMASQIENRKRSNVDLAHADPEVGERIVHSIADGAEISHTTLKSKPLPDFVPRASASRTLVGDAPSKRRKVIFQESPNKDDTQSIPAATALKAVDQAKLQTDRRGLHLDADVFAEISSQRSDHNSQSEAQKSLRNSSQQLSQSSIKSHHLMNSPHSSFQVVKNPYAELDSIKKSFPTIKNIPSTHGATTATKTHSSSANDQTKFTTSSTEASKTSELTMSPRLLCFATNYSKSCQLLQPLATHIYSVAPPTVEFVLSSMTEDGRPDVIYQEAYYKEERDAPDRSRDYAGREFKLESMTVPYLPLFDEDASSAPNFGSKPPVVVDLTKLDISYRGKREFCNLRVWEFAQIPPSHDSVAQWLRSESTPPRQTKACAESDIPEKPIVQVARPAELSQIEPPTQRNEHGFKFTQQRKTTSVKHETQYMSTMSLEVHVDTRGDLVPNPEEDPVAIVFWCFKSNDTETATFGSSLNNRTGILVLAEEGDLGKKLTKEAAVVVEEETTELDLINRMVDIVREFDPDILTGFEVHNSSWGYLIERARLKYEYNLCDEFSRMKSQSHGRFGKESDRWGFNHTSTIRVTGRHMINIWRAMRSELNLLQYTMENVAFHLLHKRIPHYSFRDLTTWYNSSTPHDVAKVVEYFLSRVQMDLEILEANELIPRTSEQARLIGVDFFSVFSRGSQFKVESFMFRIAKPENFLLVSPSRKQVGQQNALECLPLVMEPQSAFYNSPLLVLDFQSLYPSIMIAYNYCYSTCLGRIVGWRGQNKMGFADFKRQPGLLELVKDSINIAPNGIMYVKPEMRKSLLAKMLGEILETRVMVKSGMKVDKNDKPLQQLLNNRQLALKLLANVTYGYTSASFSGRMPCSEIADSIVQTARETLEKAIALIHSIDRWNAEVVYGDTDSLFVYLRGRTKDQAFQIGNEIAKAITDINPQPIKLKFEKVYFPCVLLAKKRYVGFKYESPAQMEPDFDAKGIETVRRDGTPAEQKIEEKCLKLLFRDADLSRVKQYFQRQCTKIMLGQISIQDFCFAREVKLGTYADKGPPPPGALISTRRMLEDPRTEPQYGERVPYIVITGAPGARLIDRCVAPEQLLSDDGLELDAEYYVSKNIIPPLERIFNLVGANVRQWYDEMPKVQRIRDSHEQHGPTANLGMPKYAPNGVQAPSKKTLENYMRSSTCIVCRAKLPRLGQDKVHNDPAFAEVAEEDLRQNNIMPTPLTCSNCSADAATSLYILQKRLHAAQRSAAGVEAVCRSCSGLSWAEEVRCDSKDCPVFYTRVKERAREQRVRLLSEAASDFLEQRILEW